MASNIPPRFNILEQLKENRVRHQTQEPEQLQQIQDGFERGVRTVIDDEIPKPIKDQVPDMWAFENTDSVLTHIKADEESRIEFLLRGEYHMALYAMDLDNCNEEYSRNLNNKRIFGEWRWRRSRDGFERRRQTEQFQTINQNFTPSSSELEGPRQGMKDKIRNVMGMNGGK